jgi:hypothetical protein
MAANHEPVISYNSELFNYDQDCSRTSKKMKLTLNHMITPVYIVNNKQIIRETIVPIIHKIIDQHICKYFRSYDYDYKALIRHLTNTMSDDEFPLFMYPYHYLVNTSHPDHIILNAISLQKTLIKQMNNEFKLKFVKYDICKEEIFSLTELYLLTDMIYDVYTQIKKFI